MKAIEPTCCECGKRLVKVGSGLLCIEGHGRIMPIDELMDATEVPVDHSRCERMVQIPLSYRSISAILNYHNRVGAKS